MRTIHVYMHLLYRAVRLCCSALAPFWVGTVLVHQDLNAISLLDLLNSRLRNPYIFHCLP